VDLYDLGQSMGIDVSPTLVMHNLTPSEAGEIIAECAAAEGLKFTDELVAKIVFDLTKDGQIRPPELQIVCTALTVNFTLKHYNELGGAKGILESYLTLTLETCVDQHLARLVLRQMCDFERQAKAEPKTRDEFVETVGSSQEDSAAMTHRVQLVLEHLVRSRLAVIVNGKASLIHDYWVSVIQEVTVHDRSEQENADELLKRHLYDIGAGFSSTLSSRQLSIVRRSAKRELLDTPEAASLIRKSVRRLWILRGLATAALVIFCFFGIRSSNVVWERQVLADPGTATPVSLHVQPSGRRVVITPMVREDQMSKLSVWDTDGGKKLAEYTADSWFLSPGADVLLYSNAGQSYFTDLNQLTQKSYSQSLNAKGSLEFSKSSHCALYSLRNTGVSGFPGKITGVNQLQLWSVPEGRSLGQAHIQAQYVTPVFTSDGCDLVVFHSREKTSTLVSESGYSLVWKGRTWIWSNKKSMPEPLFADARQSSAAVDTEGQYLATSESEDVSTVKIWNLRTRQSEVERTVSLGPHIWEGMRFGPGSKYVVLVTASGSKEDDKVRILRSSDLQESPLTRDQQLMECGIVRPDFESVGYFLWAIPNHGGYIWDASSSDPSFLSGFDMSDLAGCTVSSDRSYVVVLRKGGSAELWRFNGTKVANLQVRGANSVGWTEQGTTVKLEKDTGEILLFDLDGNILARLPAPGERKEVAGNYGVHIFSTKDSSNLSFQPACGHALLWTLDGRVVKYTRRFRVFDLPYTVPFFWHRSTESCEM
jgi:hypothetical protein